MQPKILYPSGLVPAALGVKHGYKNFWVRDGYYVGNCYGGEIKAKLWDGMIDILDLYKWKLEIHAHKKPQQWYEHIHIRYSPEGEEIGNEHWMHNQWDSIGNWIEICIDKNRLDIASLLIDYLQVLKYHREPAAGAWEDRNSSDAYSLAACLHGLQYARPHLEDKHDQIDDMVKKGTKRLYALLPYATTNKMVCLSLLGVIWPFELAGPYKSAIIGLVKKNLQREPFGFIRYKGDSYDGEHFSRANGTEVPWLLGDLYLALIEPKNPIWKDRIKLAQDHFGFMPEAYFPENMKANRNSPLVWAEAMAYLVG
jgi:GH15 family glucan-1,4-alpha-glucosidase